MGYHKLQIFSIAYLVWCAIDVDALQKIMASQNPLVQMIVGFITRLNDHICGSEMYQINYEAKTNLKFRSAF